MKFGLLVFKLFGVAAMVGAVVLLCWNLLFWMQADVAEGVIVKKTSAAQESYWDLYDGGARYISKSSLDSVAVEFNAADGKRYSFNPGWFDITDDYEIDDKVQILYRPMKPQSAEIYKFKVLFLGPVILFILGIGLWVASLFRLVL